MKNLSEYIEKEFGTTPSESQIQEIVKIIFLDYTILLKTFEEVDERRHLIELECFKLKKELALKKI